jgi:hypothetical protein
MSFIVNVQYKHGKVNPTNQSAWQGTVMGKSESAVMEVLNKRHPGDKINILKITWK